MIFEALFFAFPFALGLGVPRAPGRAFGSWLVLEVFLGWLGLTVFRQPILAAIATPLILSTTLYVAGMLLGARRPQLRPAFAPAIAFLSGALVMATLGGELSAQTRVNTLKTAKWVNADQDTAWKTVERLGSVEPESMRVTASEAPSHRRVELIHETTQLFHFNAVEYWLSPEGAQSVVVRSTEYESRLRPSWLWSPIERHLVQAEHRGELAQFSGEFVLLDELGVDVRLTVKTNPPTRVTIIPPVSSKRPRMVIGQTPIDEAKVARVGDTVLMENEEHGIHFEEVIEYGEPNGLKLISRVFKQR